MSRVIEASTGEEVPNTFNKHSLDAAAASIVRELVAVADEFDVPDDDNNNAMNALHAALKSTPRAARSDDDDDEEDKKTHEPKLPTRSRSRSPQSRHVEMTPSRALRMTLLCDSDDRRRTLQNDFVPPRYVVRPSYEKNEVSKQLSDVPLVAERMAFLRNGASYDITNDLQLCMLFAIASALAARMLDTLDPRTDANQAVRMVQKIIDALGCFVQVRATPLRYEDK